MVLGSRLNEQNENLNLLPELSLKSDPSQKCSLIDHTDTTLKFSCKELANNIYDNKPVEYSLVKANLSLNIPKSRSRLKKAICNMRNLGPSQWHCNRSYKRYEIGMGFFTEFGGKATVKETYEKKSYPSKEKTIRLRNYNTRHGAHRKSIRVTPRFGYKIDRSTNKDIQCTPSSYRARGSQGSSYCRISNVGDESFRVDLSGQNSCRNRPPSFPCRPRQTDRTHTVKYWEKPINPEITIKTENTELGPIARNSSRQVSTRSVSNEFTLIGCVVNIVTFPGDRKLELNCLDSDNKSDARGEWSTKRASIGNSRIRTFLINLSKPNQK